MQFRQYFLTLCLKVFKVFVFLTSLGKLFHRKGNSFLSHVCISKREFKFRKLISCTYSTKIYISFKNFSQIIKASVIDKFECNSVYTLINSLAGR